MRQTDSHSPRRKRARYALAAALLAVGCSGGSGGGCAGSCGGAFKTTNADGTPFRYAGDKLPNVAQFRVTKSGFNFLNAQHLNGVVGTLSGDSSLQQTFTAPAGSPVLSFWYRDICPGLNSALSYVQGTLRDNTAQSSVDVVAKSCTNGGSFTQVTSTLIPAHSYTFLFANHDGSDPAGYSYAFLDDVAVTGGATNPIQSGTFDAGVFDGWVTKGAVQLSSTHHGGTNSAQVGANTPAFTLPCFGPQQVFNACNLPVIGNITQVNVVAGDSNLDGQCTAADKTPLHVTFKDVQWVLDAAHNTLKAHIVLHLKTGDIYVRTVEEHSSICGGTSAIQARVQYDDEITGLPQQDTAADLNIQFTTTPDGRLEFNFDNASLDTLVTNIQPAALVLDGKIGNDPAPPTTAPYTGDGCDSGNGSYTVDNGSGSLRCAGVFNAINANCDITQDNQGGLCAIVQYIRGFLFDRIKDAFKTQIVGMLRAQLDNIRCQRSQDSQHVAHACDLSHGCGADDDGNPLTCDIARGVCYPPAQGTTGFNCEPVPLSVQGEVDVASLTEQVGFPQGVKLDLFAGLGTKGGTNGGAKVDANGLQLAAQAGTAPATASNFINVCVPPTITPVADLPDAMDFDSTANKPAGMGSYDVGFSLASAMLNRGFTDAYSSGMLCVAVTNVTSSFISSGLFKTFLPSLGLVTGGKDVPMIIFLRPTLPPYVRLGRNDLTVNPDGTTTLNDPLIQLNFKKMNLDFYALVDERQVRIFTLQADLQLPIGLRTFADPNADTLQPVLGSLDTVLTNISALSPDLDPVSGNQNAYTVKDMLAEDPGVVKDLLSAAVRLAQPLLAGIIKPIALPALVGLKVGVEGVAGAVPPKSGDLVNDGYQHLAIWAAINECAPGACERYTVKTGVKVARTVLPDSADDIRKKGIYPQLELDVSAQQARSKAAEFSYRVDGSLWSPWLPGPRLSLRDPLFLVQGHHLVEVTSREAGDDHTMDMQPQMVDFFVSYEAPVVKLRQRPDGAIVTEAHSAASRDVKLTYSYRLDGQHTWTEPGPAQVWSQDQLQGHGLSVSVADEAGREMQAHFGEEEGAELAAAGMAGCSTSAHQTAFGLLPLLGLALLLRRQRKGSSSVG